MIISGKNGMIHFRKKFNLFKPKTWFTKCLVITTWELNTETSEINKVDKVIETGSEWHGSLEGYIIDQ